MVLTDSKTLLTRSPTLKTQSPRPRSANALSVLAFDAVARSSNVTVSSPAHVVSSSSLSARSLLKPTPVPQPPTESILMTEKSRPTAARSLPRLPHVLNHRPRCISPPAGFLRMPQHHHLPLALLCRTALSSATLATPTTRIQTLVLANHSTNTTIPPIASAILCPMQCDVSTSSSAQSPVL